jgi:hypothetical protein
VCLRHPGSWGRERGRDTRSLVGCMVKLAVEQIRDVVEVVLMLTTRRDAKTRRKASILYTYGPVTVRDSRPPSSTISARDQTATSMLPSACACRESWGRRRKRITGTPQFELQGFEEWRSSCESSAAHSTVTSRFSSSLAVDR